MKKYNVNTDIAITHIFTRKRQTMVAALGVTLGIAVFLFMNSLSAGFSKYSRGEIFKSSAHIKVYREDEMSEPMLPDSSDSRTTVIINPQITTVSKTLLDPGDCSTAFVSSLTSPGHWRR